MKCIVKGRGGETRIIWGMTYENTSHVYVQEWFTRSSVITFVAGAVDVSLLDIDVWSIARDFTESTVWNNKKTEKIGSKIWICKPNAKTKTTHVFECAYSSVRGCMRRWMDERFLGRGSSCACVCVYVLIQSLVYMAGVSPCLNVCLAWLNNPHRWGEEDDICMLRIPPQKRRTGS